MRDLVRQIVEAYRAPKLEAQTGDVILFSGQDPESRQPVWISIWPRLLGRDPQIAKRFRELAQAMRQLNHPNIAAVRDVGEKSGLPYIVTQAVESARPLAEKLDQPWAVDLAADIVMQVGQGLEFAYRQGLVHGSLSPESVAVQEDGTASVTGLGASELMALLSGEVRTAASPYLAPERVEGKPATARADVYSLGAILYSLLAKRTPQVSQGRVTPPSQFNPEVPRAMDEVVVRSLSRRPEARYPDVRSFLAALGAVALVPAVKAAEIASGGRCARCGTEQQAGRFCRKCGAPLGSPKPARAAPPRSRLDEPIQITKVEVSRFEIGTGVEVQQTVIAQPVPAPEGELASLFPAPLPMPSVDVEGLWPSTGDETAIAMPEPPPMPVVDWAEIAPPMPEVPTIEDMQQGIKLHTD